MVRETSLKLILQEKNGPGQEFFLSQNQVVIGRDPSADLVISSPGVSRRHARIFFNDGHYLVEDLNSSNHSYLNGQRLDSPQALAVGDILQLGAAVKLVFAGPPADLAAQTAVASTLEEVVPVKGDQTQLGVPQPPDVSDQPPMLLVTVAGSEPRSLALTKECISLGRAPNNDVVIPSRIVSGFHASLEREGAGYKLIVSPEATNPILFRQAPIESERTLRDGDVLRIGSLDPSVIVTLVYQWPAEATYDRVAREIELEAGGQLQIGRDPSNDVTLNAPLVSRFHALIERIGQRYRVSDLASSNGTFVNDQQIEAETWLKTGDAVRIGPYRFVLGQDKLAEYDDSAGLQVEVLGLNKWVRPDLNLLKNISLLVRPREFVVVVGQSGGGKSTLVDAIAGYRPATHGQVMVNGIDIYRNFDAVRSQIGFVPQKDIIHNELTVYQALGYAARPNFSVIAEMGHRSSG